MLSENNGGSTEFRPSFDASKKKKKSTGLKYFKMLTIRKKSNVS